MPYRADGSVQSKSQAALDRQYRIARAVELRRAGLPWATVAQGSGYSSPQAAHDAVQRHLDKVATDAAQDVELLRAQELDRIDALQTSVWDRARSGNLDSIATVLDLMKQRSKLLGLERNQRALADAAGTIAGALERDVAAQVVNVVLALADRLAFTPEQRVSAPAAIVAELEARHLIRAQSIEQLEAGRSA